MGSCKNKRGLMSIKRASGFLREILRHIRHQEVSREEIAFFKISSNPNFSEKVSRLGQRGKSIRPSLWSGESQQIFA